MRRLSCRGRPRVSCRFKGSTNGATTLHCSLVKNMEAGVRANALCLYSTTFNLRLVLVAFVIKDGRKFARLTPAGSQRLKPEEEKAAFLPHRKRGGDNGWRVFISDIPERRRGVRGP